ncbi:sensor histidine kinase [Marinifilum sp.]|uniref:sensor histidine kinase n=1 Tax=Marinifilum sp. TaxID=2033137 RepID=UPI003BAA7ECC
MYLIEPTLGFDQEINKIKVQFIYMEKRPTYKELQRQLKEAQTQLKETEKLKDAFLANMSHEIRTPMNAIVGASELLRDDSLSKQDRNEFTKILTSSSKELLELFNRILELSQLESGVQEYIESEVEVHELLVNLYSSYTQKINMSGKNLVLNYTEDLSENKIFTDHKKLNKVLSYLLDNAIKFTISGEIDFGCAIQDRQNILFYVKDTGPGISDQEQAKIFNKFTQVDNSYTREHSGAGLGLSISKEIVEFLGGKLYIDSSLGDGSIFYFTIPFKFSESNIVLKEKIEAVLKQNINEIYSSSNTRKNIAI